MALEIERKFLVNGDFKRHASNSFEIVQGYLNSTPERSVRIRIKGDKGFLTIKGMGNESGVSRYEWETEIKKEDALDLLKLCEPGAIHKIRYLIPSGEHEFEVDELFDENAGLIIAEIELSHEDEGFERPDWLGREITGLPQYYNAVLMKNPYSKWKKQ